MEEEAAINLVEAVAGLPAVVEAAINLEEVAVGPLEVAVVAGNPVEVVVAAAISLVAVAGPQAEAPVGSGRRDQSCSTNSRRFFNPYCDTKF